MGIAALVLLLAEGALRLAGFTYHEVPLHLLFENNRARFPLTEPDPDTFWRLIPGVAVPFQDRWIFTDARGDRVAAEEVEGGECEVWLAGDSIVFGQVTTMAVELQAILDENLAPRRFTVRNAGVPGFTSFQVRVRLERDPPSPGSIVAVYVGFNDYGKNRVRYTDADRTRLWPPPGPALRLLEDLLGGSRLMQALRRGIRGPPREPEGAGEASLDPVALEPGAPPASPPEVHSPPKGLHWPDLVPGLPDPLPDWARAALVQPCRVRLAEFQENLRAIVRLGRERGFAVLLQTCPTALRWRLERMGLMRRNLDSLIAARYQEGLRRVAAETGAPLVDHERAWREREVLELFDQPFNDAVHPNDVGLRILAEGLYEGARKAGLWGEDAPALPQAPRPPLADPWAVALPGAESDRLLLGAWTSGGFDVQVRDAGGKRVGAFTVPVEEGVGPVDVACADMDGDGEDEILVLAARRAGAGPGARQGAEPDPGDRAGVVPDTEGKPSQAGDAALEAVLLSPRGEVVRRWTLPGAHLRAGDRPLALGELARDEEGLEAAVATRSAAGIRIHLLKGTRAIASQAVVPSASPLAEGNLGLVLLPDREAPPLERIYLVLRGETEVDGPFLFPLSRPPGPVGRRSRAFSRDERRFVADASTAEVCPRTAGPELLFLRGGELRVHDATNRALAASFPWGLREVDPRGAGIALAGRDDGQGGEIVLVRRGKQALEILRFAPDGTPRGKQILAWPGGD